MVERLTSFRELRCVVGVGRADSPKVAIWVMRIRGVVILEDRGEKRLQGLRYGGIYLGCGTLLLGP